MTKARNGEGSIRTIKTRDGKVKYQVEISLGFGPNGKRKRTRRTVKTLSEAKALRTKLLSDQMYGRLTIVDGRTVKDYGLHWVRDVKSQRVRPSTAADYEDRLRRYIIPELGRFRMIDLRPQQVDHWLAALRNAGYSAPTVNGARQVLFGMCKHATRTGLLGSNPVSATDPVKRQKSDVSQVRGVWSHEEMIRVLLASRDTPLEAFLHLMLHTGMRPGEALGLRWEDVDEDLKILRISGTLKEERRILPDGQAVVRLVRNDPKTKESRRPLPISPALAEVLGKQRTLRDFRAITSSEDWKDSGYVLTTGRGTPYSSSNIRKMFVKFLETIDVPYIRLHDMRHTVAHHSLNTAETPLEQTSQALGHTRTDTTKRIYAGEIPRYYEEFVRKLGGILPPPVSPKYIEGEKDESEHAPQ